MLKLFYEAGKSENTRYSYHTFLSAQNVNTYIYMQKMFSNHCILQMPEKMRINYANLRVISNDKKAESFSRARINGRSG